MGFLLGRLPLCRAQALGTRASEPAAGGCPQPGAGTRVPCTGRWVLDPWGTRDVFTESYLFSFSFKVFSFLMKWVLDSVKCFFLHL